MLGRNYRFSVNNQCGVNVTVTIQARRWKMDTDGSLSFDSEAEVFNEAGITSSSSSWTNDTAVDNSTDKWIGADLEIAITPASSVTGTSSTTVTVQIQRSTDGGTTWPDAGLGEWVMTHQMPSGTATATLQASIGA